MFASMPSVPFIGAAQQQRRRCRRQSRLPHPTSLSHRRCGRFGTIDTDDNDESNAKPSQASMPGDRKHPSKRFRAPNAEDALGAGADAGAAAPRGRKRARLSASERSAAPERASSGEGNVEDAVAADAGAAAVANGRCNSKGDVEVGGSSRGGEDATMADASDVEAGGVERNADAVEGFVTLCRSWDTCLRSG